MNTRLSASRQRVLRRGAGRRAQGGAVVRGVIVATALVGAVVLQLAGSRLQCRLADLVGVPSATPVMAPASMPSCGSPSGANPMHPCKVAVATAGTAPVI
jgi:hypothetical protein